LVYLFVFHAYVNEMHGSRIKISSKKSCPYMYDVKFLALLGAPYIYDISRLRVNVVTAIKSWLGLAECVACVGRSKHYTRNCECKFLL
jgi:hypothetical protein